jgi:hypothetical protein
MDTAQATTQSVADLETLKQQWLTAGRDYTERLMRIVVELGEPVYHSGRNYLVFCTDNTTLIYHRNEVYLKRKEPNCWGTIESVFVSVGEIIDYQKVYLSSDNFKNVICEREFRTCVLKRTDFDPVEFDIDIGYEVFVPEFSGWIEEVLSNHEKAEIKFLGRQAGINKAKISALRKELLIGMQKDT